MGRRRYSGSTRLTSVVLLAAFPVACSTDRLLGPRGDLTRVRPEQSTYLRGDFVHIAIENTSRSAILQDMCAGQVQTWTGESWERSSTRSCLVGGPPPRRIEARAVVRDSLRIRLGAPPGRYRIELRLLALDATPLARDEGISGEFRVVAFRE